jgi:glutamate carboxypeptidase
MDEPSPALTDRFLDDLMRLVSCESPTEDVPACAAALQLLADLVLARLGRPATVLRRAGRPHLLVPAAGPRARVLLLGHVDTVWPLGTSARWPFAVADGRATGPGVFDMKAGLVMALHALASVGAPVDVALLVTSDEETGSATSQALVEEVATTADAVLVLEPGFADGSVKSARKGVAMYRIDIAGRAAHAGLEPELGVNALVQLADLVPTICATADPAAGTTVTPTIARAGTTVNTVPAAASVHVDVRARTAAELDRVHGALTALGPTLPDATVGTVLLGRRPPLEPTASAALLTRLRAAAADAGLPAPGDVAVGGGSDGNFTAGMGVPTLDGLGGVGAGAHAEGEHIDLAGTAIALARLTALLAAL